MDIFSIYIATFFIVFLIIPTIYFVLRFLLWFFLDYCGWCGSEYRNRRANNLNRSRNVQQRTQQRRYQDRQGNIYTVSDDIASNNVPPRFADFFYLEPGSDEAARIRAQLEKDDKELPSYEEVLRMTALTPTSATTVAALPATMPPMPTALGVSNTSFATSASDLSLPPAPPYTEIDMNATMSTAAEVAPQSMTSTSTTIPLSVAPIAASTSRAAASLVITSPVTAVTTSTTA